MAAEGRGVDEDQARAGDEDDPGPAAEVEVGLEREVRQRGVDLDRIVLGREPADGGSEAEAVLQGCRAPFPIASDLLLLRDPGWLVRPVKGFGG